MGFLDLLFIFLFVSIISCFISLATLLEKRALSEEAKDSVIELKRRKLVERIYKRCKRKFTSKKERQRIFELFDGDFDAYVRFEVAKALEWEGYYYELE